MNLWDLSNLIGIDACVISNGLKNRDDSLSLSLSLRRLGVNYSEQHQDAWLKFDSFPHHAIKAIARYYAPMERKASAALTFLDCLGV